MNDSENNVSYNTLCTLGIEYKPSGNLVRIIVNGTLGDSLEIITEKPYVIPAEETKTQREGTKKQVRCNGNETAH